MTPLDPFGVTSRNAPTGDAGSLASWYTQGRSDGLGDRLLMTDNTGAESLELLRFHASFVSAFGFETARRTGAEVHDEIEPSPGRTRAGHVRRRSNRGRRGPSRRR